MPMFVFRVLCGSGQGLVHSAAVANSAFLHSTELNGAGLARAHVQRNRGILHYIRYVDNLLFVVKDCNVLESIIPWLQGVLAPTYSGKVEAAGTAAIPFLDLALSIESGRIAFQPLIKSKGPVLSHDSNHPSAIHLSWPLAYVNSLKMHSCGLASFESARQGFLQRLGNSFLSPEFVDCIDKGTRYFDIIHFHNRSKAAKGSRMIVPFVFHRVWQRNVFSSAFREHSQDPFCCILWETVFGKSTLPRLMASWSIRERPFGASFIEW